jgi:hypothetical protein
MRHGILAAVLLAGTAFAQEPAPPAPARIAAAQAKRTQLSVMYLRPMFAHVHQNPSRHSASLTTITCGQPVKVMAAKWPDGREDVLVDGHWHMVDVGPYQGYLDREMLSDKRPECFQDRYPRFFDAIGAELSDLYYWGRLYDQLVIGKSRVR